MNSCIQNVERQKIEFKDFYNHMTSCDKVRQALQWLNDKGWSDLIEPRWTLEVYHELQTSGLGLTDADIREALDLVIFDKPDYEPANNERL